MTKDFAALKKHLELEAPAPDKTKLLYYLNKLTGMYGLCISFIVALDVFAIAHKEGHPGFAWYYKIISCSWFMQKLSKLLRSFIRHCLQYLALQIRRHPSYGSLQPIDSLPILFFILTLNLFWPCQLAKKNIMRWYLSRVKSQNG